MRATKPEYLKAKKLMISVPNSFAEFIQQDCGNASFTVQRWVAQRVVGDIMGEHWAAYENSPNMQYKKESHKKSYIRLVRWILESKISKMWENDGVLFLRVKWDITQAETLCCVDFYTGPGFHHVIYDEEIELDDPILDHKKTKVVTKLDIKKFPPRCSKYKLKVVSAWIRHSYQNGDFE